MYNDKKGISLVALVITIIVLIILTGAVIMTMNQGNTISKSKEAVFKSDITNFREELRNNILQEQLNDQGFSKEEVTTQAGGTNKQDIKYWIPSITDEYLNKLQIINGELKYIGTTDIYETVWSQSLGIKTNNTPLSQSDYETVYNTEIDNAEQVGLVQANNGEQEYIKDSEYYDNPMPSNITSVAIPYGTTYITNNCFDPNPYITDVVIPETVNIIGMTAFGNCTALANVTIPNGVEYIVSYAFSNCTSLRNIFIPNSVIFIGEEAFWGCTTNIYIDNTSANVELGMNAFPSTCTVTYLR